MENGAQLRLFEPEQQTRVDYELLHGHRRTDGSYKTDEQLRSQYVHLTDNLIHHMTEGIMITDPVTGERRKEIPDVVVWLDKSARPVSWLTKELWSTLAPEPGSEIVPDMPQFAYVNIDREQWVNDLDPHGNGQLDIDHVKPSIIRSLRSIFVDRKHKEDGITDAIDNAPSELDGKTVLIIDEVRSTGRTLEIAQKFFRRAFPSAKIAGAFWMDGVANRGDRKSGVSQGNADLPIWYKEKSVTGRGVGNRDERVSSKSVSLTQRLGSWFLSTALREQDESASQLRAEMHQLGKDVRNGDILVVPGQSRDLDDYDQRATALNHMTFEGYKNAKQLLGRVS